MRHWFHYRTPSRAHRRLGLVCLGVGGDNGVVHCPPRTLDTYAAVLLVAGRGTLSMRSRSYSLNGPLVFWLRPGQEHSYRSDAHGWRDFWALFDGPVAAAYSDLGYFDGAQPVTRLDEPAAVRRVFEDLAGCCRDGGPDVDVDAAVHMHRLLSTIRRNRADRDRSSIPVLTALRQSAALPLSIAQHARRLGCSTDELRRQVRAATGVGVKEYLQQCRLNRAKELLADVKLPIAAVARDLGYTDAAYFTRIFTHRVGISPSAFRAQLPR